MRFVSPSVVFGVALMFGLSGSVLLAQEQPAAGAPPPSATSQAQPANPSTAPDQAQQPGASQPSGMQPRQAPNPERQARMLAKKLRLTQEQQSEIEPILAERQQQVQSIRADSALAPSARRRKLHGVARESDRKIQAVLTDAQKQQYQQLKQERRARRQMRMERQAGAPPAA